MSSEKTPNEFTWAQLREALREEFPLAVLEDTGGGCIVAQVRKAPGDVLVQLGPGSSYPLNDEHGLYGVEFRLDDFSIGTEDEIGPQFHGMQNLAEIVEHTRIAHALYNNGRDHWEFMAEDILSRLREEFPASFCEQTGGGTATLYIRKVETDIAVCAGPGSFNWNAPDQSSFHCGEFSAGMEPYKNDGMDEREAHEQAPDVALELAAPIPAEFDRIAKLIAAAHAEYNSGKYPA